MLGSFSATRISPRALSALQRLLAWKLSLHGTPATGRVTVRVNPAGASYSKYPANARVSLRRVSGHRDADSTDCPGNALYVGNDMYRDIYGARDAGLTTVMFDSDQGVKVYRDCVPDYRITDFRDLLKILSLPSP